MKKYSKKIGIYILCICLMGMLVSDTSRVTTIDHLLPFSGIYYRYGTNLSVATYNNQLLMNITFDHMGVNKLFGIAEVELREKAHILVVPSFTDWLSPYMLGEYGEKIRTTEFSGGWHGKDYGMLKLRTAKTVDVSLFVDGEKVKRGGSGYTENLEIQVTNLIKGYNSTQYLIEEKVTYKILADQMNVSVEIKALEDAIIYKYYGLQSQNTEWDNSIAYLLNGSKETETDLTHYSKGGDPDKFLGRGFLLTGKMHPFTLKGWINLDQGLADYANLDVNQPCIFTVTYPVGPNGLDSKTYFNLINGNDLILLQNQKVFWSGGYQFGVR